MELESQTHLFSKGIESVAVGSGSIGQEGTHFCRTTEENGGFEANHFDIFCLRHIGAGFKIDIHLLPLTDLDGALGEERHYLLHASDSGRGNEAVGKQEHGVAREYGCVVVPATMYRCLSAPHLRAVHKVIVQEGVVVVGFDAHSSAHGALIIRTKQAIGREEEHRPQALSSH